MARLGKPGRQLRSLLWRAPVEDEVAAELEHHLELRTREYIERGLDPAAARKAALARLGDRERVAAECRRIGRQRDRRMHRTEYVNDLGQDVRYAVRQLRRTPLLSGAAIVTLALGIGATTGIFSAVKAVLLSPFPYGHPERVVLVSEELRGGRGEAAPGNFADWRRRARSFEALAAMNFVSFNLADEGRPERVLGAEVSPALFDVLGVEPVLGRRFAPEAEEPGGEGVVVLSHELWRRRYAGDPRLMGHDIRLNGIPHTVIGIMPPGFDPTLTGEELWVPFTLGPERRADYDNHFLNVLGLLRPDVSIARADEEMEQVAREQVARAPRHNRERSARVESLPRLLVGPYRSRLPLMLGAVFFILLIACANVANLLLANGAARAKELAVRAALGAGRERVIRQLLTESLVLSLFAGALGVGLAFVGIRALVGAAPPGIPRIGDTNVDLSVLGFALAVSVVAAVLSGLVPALRAARRDIESTLRDGRIASAARKGRDRTRTGLVVAEVALAFTLLVGAGLLIRSVHNLGRQPLGFEPRGVITARVTLPAAGYGTPDQLIETFRRIPRLLRERPGVRSAAVTSQAPLGPGGNGNGLLPEGRPDEPENRVFARLRIVTPNYFETMGIPLVRGRGFRESDVRGAARVMVVSEELARRAWPGVDPIGKRIICCEGSPDDPRWKTVIGVAGDVRSGGAAASLRPEFYLPIRQVPADAWNWIDRTMTVVARAANNPGALAGTFRDVLNEVDPTLPVYRARTMQQELRSSLAANRFQMTLLALLGVTGLVLAALGIYGVISYFVNLRTPEIGLRMALGATGLDVMSLLTRQGLTPVLAGLVIGLALALAATRLLSGLLFGVATADPITYAAVAIVFVVTATLAILFPARRAARIDPTRALEAK